MARPVAKKKVAEAQAMVDRYKGDFRSLRQYHKAMKLEYGYNVKLKHHGTIEKKRASDPDPLTISTLDLYDITRYSTGQIEGSPIYIDVRPAEPGHDEIEQADLDDAAMIARSVMDEQLHDMDIGYPRVRRRFIRMGLAARAGACVLDVVPGGPFGANVIPRTVKPWLIAWDARFMHPLEPGNLVVWEIHENVPLEDIHENPDFGPSRTMVRPDDGKRAFEVDDVEEVEPAVDEDAAPEVKTATLVTGWLMDDPTTVEVLVGEPKKLDPQNYYMACGTCGYTERDLSTDPTYDGSLLPETMPCPKCGKTPEGIDVSQMHRIETEREYGSAPAYENRNRRIVFAPFSPDAGLLRDGPWPKGLTRFPLLYYVPDPFPIEPTGNSQTFLNMDLQSLKNASLVDGFLQMSRNKDLTIAKNDSLWDAAGNPYMFDGTGDRIAYTTSYDDLQGIRHFQGSGLNAAFGLWWETIDSEVNKHRGIGQASGTPEDLKGVNVGTIARSMETGDVPLDSAVRILREDEGPLFSRWFELLCGCRTEKQWVDAAGPDGQTATRLFDPQAMPALKLKVHAAPDLNAADREQMKAASEMAQIQSPTLLQFAAQQAKLPKHVVEGMVKELRDRLAPPPAPIGPSLTGPTPPGVSGTPAMPEPMVPAVT